MRTKAILMSTGLAATFWLTGCQNTSLSKLAAHCTGGATCSSCLGKACPDSKDSLPSDLNRTGDKTEKTTRVTIPFSKTPPAAPAAVSAKDGVAARAAKAPDTIAAQTGSVVVREAGKYTLPAVPPAPTPEVSSPLPPPIPEVLAPSTSDVPQVEITLPPSIDVAASAPTIRDAVPASAPPQQLPPPGPNFGAGIEVVANPANEKRLAAPARSTAANDSAARIGQVNNYQIVVGHVHQFRRVWKLRYAGVDTDDKYGGTFTLVGDNLDNLKDGQLVRVEGSVLSTEDRVNGARYQVNRVEVIETEFK